MFTSPLRCILFGTPSIGGGALSQSKLLPAVVVFCVIVIDIVVLLVDVPHRLIGLDCPLKGHEEPWNQREVARTA